MPSAFPTSAAVSTDRTNGTRSGDALQRRRIWCRRPRSVRINPSGARTMRPTVIVSLAAILVPLAAAAAGKDTLAPAGGRRHDLVKDGRTTAMIVLPARPDMLEGYAAGELQRYVKEITGRILPIINEPETPEGAGDYNEPQKLAGYGIWLGQTKAAESARFTLTEAKLGRDGYAAKADDKGLVLVGRCP